MKPSVDYTLYLVTDRDLMSTPTLEEAVEQAIRGGVTLVQLREKHASSLEFYQTALRVKKITDSYNVPLIINDRVDVALAVDADGVHVGQSDLPAARVREILGPDKILGVSASSLKEASQSGGGRCRLPGCRCYVCHRHQNRCRHNDYRGTQTYQASGICAHRGNWRYQQADPSPLCRHRH